MWKIMYFKIGERNVHLPKLIGAFILLAAVLMFFKAGAIMFESWDNTKLINNCLNPNEVPVADFDTCKTIAMESSGIYLRPGQEQLNSKQFWSILLGPIASLLFWLVVFIFGLMLYRTGDLVLPLEEEYFESPSKPKGKSSGKKKR